MDREVTEQLIEEASEIAPLVKEGLDEVLGRVETAATSAGRDPGSISVVVVTKGRPPVVALAAWLAGAKILGENRADELATKATLLEPAFGHSDVPPPKWHFIGHLQRNKARHVIGIATVIHSLDSSDLARELIKRSAGAEIEPPACLVEVNVAREAQKYGVNPGELAEFIGDLPLRPSGLMCMAPKGAGFEEARRVFAELAMLGHDMSERFPSLDLASLSMGMTDDFEAAIAEGATILRIGRAIFRHLR
ncbi:MAG: YggS family pyridoxal phosphate-dependent enzyme [Acidobacteria bacterium]|nr:MAG: YggS family pyridoxal phosphate-dependent enzyme [Acidobacteriota bacterium]